MILFIAGDLSGLKSQSSKKVSAVTSHTNIFFLLLPNNRNFAADFSNGPLVNVCSSKQLTRNESNVLADWLKPFVNVSRLSPAACTLEGRQIHLRKSMLSVENKHKNRSPFHLLSMQTWTNGRWQSVRMMLAEPCGDVCCNHAQFFFFSGGDKWSALELRILHRTWNYYIFWRVSLNSNKTNEVSAFIFMSLSLFY